MSQKVKGLKKSANKALWLCECFPMQGLTLQPASLSRLCAHLAQRTAPLWALCSGLRPCCPPMFPKTVSLVSTYQPPTSSPMLMQTAWSPCGHVCHQTPFCEPKDGSGQSSNQFKISENFWLLHLKIFQCIPRRDQILLSPLLLPSSFFFLLLFLILKCC